MKIHYYDFVASGGVHTSFNAAMIEVLRKVYPENKGVVLHSEKEHSKIVAEKLSDKTIIQKSWRILFSKIVCFSKIRDLLSSIYLFFAIICAKNCDVFYIALAFPFAVNTAFAISKVFHKKLFITLHGELQFLLDNDPKIYEQKHNWYFRSEKKSFSKFNKYVTWVLLGEPIFNAVKDFFNQNAKIICINHPAILKENIHFTKKTNEPVVIGHIGGAMERKGSHSLFRIAELLEDEIKKGKVVFSCGWCLPNFDASLSKNLVQYYTRPLSESEMKSEIERMDFSLQLTTDSICRAVASGALIDSLSNSIPVIGLHSSYLDYYMQGEQKKFIFNNEKEIAEKIKNDILSHNYDSDSLCKTVWNIRNLFSISYNAELFSKQMENIK